MPTRCDCHRRIHGGERCSHFVGSRESIARVQVLIEPALTVILGALLGWIMLSVLGPIYDVISKVKV